MNNQIPDFLIEMIEFHGFSSNSKTGFSCCIPDPKQYSKKEGLLLWVCNPKGRRIATKMEHLLSESRKGRLMAILNITEQDFENEIIPKIRDYSKMLKQFDSLKIGKGVAKNMYKGFSNQSIPLSNFKNNLMLLKEFEKFLLNNPLTLYAQKKGIFTAKEKDKLLFDKYFPNYKQTF